MNEGFQPVTLFLGIVYDGLNGQRILREELTCQCITQKVGSEGIGKPLILLHDGVLEFDDVVKLVFTE